MESVGNIKAGLASSAIKVTIDPESENPNARQAFGAAIYAEALLIGEQTCNGQALPGLLAEFGENVEAVRDHLAAIHERVGAMAGRIDVLSAALGHLASRSGTIDNTIGAITGYHDRL